MRPYEPADQPGIDQMMQGIAAEYPQAISGPHSVKIAEAYRLPNQRYWVALDGHKVVGTVGVILLAEQNAVLKRMMTDKDYRGASTGLASRLMATAIQWARSHGTTTIYLGTMAQFVAAQRFYQKHGFEEVPLEGLPADLVVNPIDSLHYRLNVSSFQNQA